MSDDEAKRKKAINDERAKQEAMARELEQLRLEEQKRKLAADMNEPKAIVREEDEVRYTAASPSISGDWKKILEDFKKQYPNVAIENNILVFASQQDAIDFFEKQATAVPPREFLVSEITPDGQPTGFKLYSCGDGMLYQGTLNEIHDALVAAQKDSPNPKREEGIASIARLLNNPTTDFRSSVQDSRPSEQEVGAAPKPKFS